MTRTTCHQCDKPVGDNRFFGYEPAGKLKRSRTFCSDRCRSVWSRAFARTLESAK